MPSPFPGMDPYLETSDAWSDFHHAAILEIRNDLVPRLPPRYIAKVDQHVYIREPSASERRLVGLPDVYVALLTERPIPGASRAKGPLVAPVIGEVQTELESARIAFIEILDKRSRSVVTTIELLTPSNKSDDRVTYLDKRRKIALGGGNLVEIDLLRGGPRLPVLGLPDCDYYALVARAKEHPKAGIWPFTLRDPLPVIPIPLADDDPDVLLDLRLPVDKAYDGAGYASYIYDSDPDPPLSADDRTWAAGLLSAARIVA